MCSYVSPGHQLVFQSSSTRGVAFEGAEPDSLPEHHDWLSPFSAFQALIPCLPIMAIDAEAGHQEVGVPSKPSEDWMCIWDFHTQLFLKRALHGAALTLGLTDGNLCQPIGLTVSRLGLLKHMSIFDAAFTALLSDLIERSLSLFITSFR